MKNIKSDQCKRCNYSGADEGFMFSESGELVRCGYWVCDFPGICSLGTIEKKKDTTVKEKTKAFFIDMEVEERRYDRGRGYVNDYYDECLKVEVPLTGLIAGNKFIFRLNNKYCLETTLTEKADGIEPIYRIITADENCARPRDFLDIKYGIKKTLKIDGIRYPLYV
jgi:hypothetical protein